MNIVVLDGYTLNPGDLSWEGLDELGECKVYDRTPEDEVIGRVKKARIVLTNKAPLTEETINNLPELEYIGVLATGYNVVDVISAAKRGIPVTNVPAYGTRSVAQMTFALLLELTQHAGHHSNTVRQGKWSSGRDFCYWDYPLIELHGKNMGLVGFGRIGRATAEIAKAFGMNVTAYDPHTPADEKEQGVKTGDLNNLFEKSDVVSLHCPLTEDNERMVNAERIGSMKKTSFLINTSRGPLVDERALADALNDGRIAGAGLDVLSIEPPGADNPLLKAKNCVITPHISWATAEARSRLMNTAVDNIRAFLSGSPENVVNGVKL